MNDNLPTVWDAEPHTRAKHAILKRYLQAWMAILSHQSSWVPKGSRAILYVDGFAGPGVYRDGDPGSPIIAVRTAMEYQDQLPVPVRFLFIELDEARFKSLELQIATLGTSWPRHNVQGVELRMGDCATVLRDLVQRPLSLGGKFGPAMVFLDQFGYSQIPIDLIGDIMAWPQCEVFTYLNWDHLNQYMSDPGKAAGITRAYGSDDWRPALAMTGRPRQSFMLDLYRETLRSRGKAAFVVDFAMYDDVGKLIYWLFFCTNSLRGVEEMKKAMWKVDDTGHFQFSDRNDPNQMILLGKCDDGWLRSHLLATFKGQTVTHGEIRRHVLLNTPCVKYKEVLNELELSERIGVVDPPTGRMRGKFPDTTFDMRLTFNSQTLFGG